MTDMTDFEKVLVNRDNITAKQAKRERNRAEEMLYSILDEGGSYGEVEEMLIDEYGLEMDYIFDLM